MTCPEWQDKLIDYTLEELSPGEARDLELHIERCAACVNALNEIRATHRLMKEHLTDRQMPAHLVLVPERPANLPLRLLVSPWGAAALGGALAAFFFLGLLLGGPLGPARRPALREPGEKAALTRSEIEGVVAREVAARMAEQKTDLQKQNEKLLATIRQERAESFARLGRHLEYLQTAQNAIWKETQQENALVEVIARNSLGATNSQTVKK
jgi:anti-sigma factor RsiW